MRRTRILSLGLLALGAMPAGAAEMGRAPVASGVFVTFDGGYAFLDQDSVFGHAVNPSGLVGNPVNESTVSPDDGWFAGGSIGVIAPGAGFGPLPFNRLEAYLSYSEHDTSVRDTTTGIATIDMNSVDAQATATIGGTGTSTIETRTWEGGLRFSVDQPAAGNISLVWSVVPFVRHLDEAVRSVAVGTADTAWRSGDTDTWMYGASLLVEPEVWVTPDIALVGRAGVGVYGYDADGDYRSRSTAGTPDPFGATVADNEAGVGFRGSLGAGVKVRLAPSATLTGLFEADHFSHVGSAALPDNDFNTATPSSVRTDDAWDLRAGARLSIGLN